MPAEEQATTPQSSACCPSWWHHFDAFAPTVGFGSSMRWLVDEFMGRDDDGDAYLVHWNAANRGPSPLPAGASRAVLKVMLVRNGTRDSLPPAELARTEMAELADVSKHALFPAVYEHGCISELGADWCLIIGEYCDCLDLHRDIVRRREKRKESQLEADLSGPTYAPGAAERIFAQMVAALQHLHRCNVVHGDVNPRKIAVTSRGLYKLADVGMPSVRTRPGNLTAALEYTAPELLKLGATADVAADVWALGVTMFEVLTLELPFRCTEGNFSAMRRLMQRKRLAPLSSPEGLRMYPWLSAYNIELLRAVDAMLLPDPQQRPSMGQLVRVPYVASTIADFAEAVQQAPQWLSTPEKLANPSLTDSEKAQLQPPHRCVQQCEAEAVISCLRADGLGTVSTSQAAGVPPTSLDPGVDENEEPVPVRGDVATKTQGAAATALSTQRPQKRRLGPMAAAVLGAEVESAAPAVEQSGPETTVPDAYCCLVSLLDGGPEEVSDDVSAVDIVAFEDVMRRVLEAECCGARSLIVHAYRGWLHRSGGPAIAGTDTAATSVEKVACGDEDVRPGSAKKSTPESQPATPNQRGSPCGNTPYSPKLCQRTPSMTSSDAGDSEADSSYSLANSTRGLLTAEEARLAASSSVDLGRSQTQGVATGSSRGPSAAGARGREGGVTPTTGGAEQRRKALERHVASQRTARRIAEVEEASERAVLAEVLLDEWHEEVALRLVDRLEPAIRHGIVKEHDAALDNVVAGTTAFAFARAVGWTEPPHAAGLDIVASGELVHRAAAAFFCGPFIGAHADACTDRERIERSVIAASWRRHCTECQCLADELAVSAAFSAPGIDVDGLCGRVLREAPAPAVSKPPPPLSTDPDDELSPVRRQFVHAPPPLVFCDGKGGSPSPVRSDGRPQRRPPTAPASRTRPQEEADRTTAKLRSIRSAQTYLAPTPRRVVSGSPPRSRASASPSSTAEKDLAALHTLRALIAAASPVAGEDGSVVPPHDGSIEFEARPPLVPAPPTHHFAGTPAPQSGGFAHTARPRSARQQGAPYASNHTAGHGRSPRAPASAAATPRPPSAKAKEASQRATVAAYARVLRNTSKVDGSPTKSTESSVATVLGTMRPVHLRSSDEIAQEMRRRERRARKARRKAKREADAAMKASAANAAAPAAEMYIGEDEDEHGPDHQPS